MDRKKKLSMFSTFRQFMETCMVSDGSGALHKIFDEKIFGFGTAIDEKIFGIKEVKKLLNSQQKQSKGLDIKWKIKPVSRFITADENTAVFADDLHLSIRAGKETVKMYIRFSVVLNFINDQWKVIHWHGSKPEQVESEKDTWGVENWKQKATELQRLVDEKTADLIGKNRELEIETALERTRTRSLLMQHSDELLDISKVFHEQLLLLGIDSAFSFVWLPNEEKGDHLFWATWMEERDGNKQFHTRAITYPLDMTEPYTAACFVDWQSGVSVHEHFIAPENIDTFFASWTELLEGAERLKPAFFPDGIYYTEAFMKYGCFGIDIRRPLSPQEKEILHRFAIEFERSYTRFLDLKKAEAQTREAQIEAALEKVRSRSLAMHKSDELVAVVKVLFEKLKDLEIPVTAVGISIYIEDSKDLDNFTCGQIESGIAINNYRLPYFDHKIANDFFEIREKGLEFFEGHYSKEEKDSFYEYVIEHSQLKDELPDDIKQFVFQSPSYSISVAATRHAMITLNDFEGKSLSENEIDILKRFSKVFDQAYTRFLDLQKAEAQAREAQIQLGLERVRARTMAMQKQGDLFDVVNIFGEQLVALGLRVDYVTFINGAIVKGRDWDLWGCSPGLELPAQRNFIPYKELAYFTRTAEKIALYEKSGDPIQVKSFTKEEKDAFLDHYFSYAASLPDEFKQSIYDTPGSTIVDAFMSEVTVSIVKYELDPYTQEQVDIFQRFSKEFRQAYIRFLDLQKAEAQAREAQIEASLERVRSKAMAMHSSQDLADTIGVFYKELQSFSITPRRCGVGLLKKENKEGEVFTWNTTEKGESLELVGKIKMEGHPVLENVYRGWLNQTDYFPVLRGNEIKEYYKIIRPMIAFPDYNHDEVQYGYFFFFKEGGVYAWTQSEMQEDELQIYRRFTSVLSLTYKRYKDLQQAEALAEQARLDLIQIQTEKKRAEEALAELQSTQKQLIQSEKMASLGELTAGIAHEIQNPLNFVNNFSEVSKELLDEMKEAIEKGDTEDAKEIMNDVIQNLEKINHHGKRADGIVKGMLQHSRSSSGQKEPTDINALCDEYLRLAYHGLRARDKSFNAKFETDLDASIGKINVMPQDLGRVVLNLINNAFYAVSERKKNEEAGYEPTVSVSTINLHGNIEIRVKDNGTGIPQNVLDKVFQPFFTTKPTGQGTGLGLSLSYDIVKAHGGELKVETKEGEETVFTIILPLKDNESDQAGNG